MEKEETKNGLRIKCLLAFVAVIITISLASCVGPKAVVVTKSIDKQLTPLPDSSEVTIFERGDAIPEHSEVLGGIAFSQRGSLEDVWETAKKEARAVGGNGLEVQVYGYFPLDSLNGYTISAFILNINDNITPSKPLAFNKIDFPDYVVMKEGDTLPCSVNFESEDRLLFYYDYNKQGYKKSYSLPKSDLLSYHIDDPDALEETQRRNKRLFNMQFALNVGGALCLDKVVTNYYSTSTQGFSGSCDVRFNIKHSMTVGLNYCYFNSEGLGHYHYNNGLYPLNETLPNVQEKTRWIAGSFGFTVPIIPKQQKMNHILDGGGWYPSSMRRHLLVYNILLGYLYREHEETNGNDHSSWTGGSFALGLNLGYDYLLTEHLGIGIGFGMLNISDPFISNFYAGIRYYL